MRSQAQAKSTWTCQKSHFVWKFKGKNAHGHVRRAMLCGHLQEKRHRHRSQEPLFCALRGPRFGGRLRHMLQDPFCMEIYRKNAAHPFPGTHFVWRFAGKDAHGQCTRAILCGNLKEKCRTRPCPPRPNTAPFYSYRKNPFSVATLFGEKSVKTRRSPSTFGSLDVENVHAVVARITFGSKNAQNTICSDQFLKIRWRSDGDSMSKKCTPLWCEARLEVKCVKN